MHSAESGSVSGRRGHSVLDLTGMLGYCNVRINNNPYTLTAPSSFDNCWRIASLTIKLHSAVLSATILSFDGDVLVHELSIGDDVDLSVDSWAC